MAEVLGTAGIPCALDPDGSPAGAVIRVLYSAPFFALDVESGRQANTQPEVVARTADVSALVPEATILVLEGQRYVAERSERVEGAGDAWRRLPLRKV